MSRREAGRDAGIDRWGLLLRFLIPLLTTKSAIGLPRAMAGRKKEAHRRYWPSVFIYQCRVEYGGNMWPKVEFDENGGGLNIEHLKCMV